MSGQRLSQHLVHNVQTISAAVTRPAVKCESVRCEDQEVPGCNVLISGSSLRTECLVWGRARLRIGFRLGSQCQCRLWPGLARAGYQRLVLSLASEARGRG